MPDGTDATRPRVVVLGGGFAGVGAARKLKKADVDVVLVDKHDYHTFQLPSTSSRQASSTRRPSDTRCAIW